MAKIIMLKGVSGSGKGQPKDAVIPTPCGDRRIGDICVGDYVFGSDGKPTRVTGVFPRGVLPVYRVSFEDGAELVVDGDHIWTFEGRKSRSRNSGLPVRYNYTTKELYADMDLVSRRGKKHLPLVAPVEYGDNKVDIDPYVLGLYLADGSSNHGCVRITKKECGVVDYMNELPDAPHEKHHYGNSTPYYTYPRGGNRLHDYLKKTGLLNKRSAGKFIPEEMFYKSIEVRKRLLYGLMDGDGSIRKKRGSVKSRIAKYSTTSKRLKDDIVRLVTGLGGATLARLVDTSRSPYWQVNIYTKFNPFLASHEVREWRCRNFRLNTYRTVKSIEKIGYDEVVCIAVEASDQLYVADTRFHILTHNTTWAKKEMSENGNYMRISKDDIRENFFGGYKQNRERFVVRTRNQLIRLGISMGRTVIVDDTNLNPVHERTLGSISRELGVALVINDSFLEVPPEECIKRDLHRGDKAVGASAIWEQYYHWVAPNPQRKLNKEFNKPRAVICDLDGTLCLKTSNRSYYDLDRVGEGSVDPFIGCILSSLSEYGVEMSGSKYPSIILLSGRNESCRKETEEWLERNMIPYDMLLMRPHEDKRTDAEVKESIYHEIIEPNYAILGVFEDRPRVARKWRSLGLRVAQLGFPEIEF